MSELGLKAKTIAAHWADVMGVTAAFTVQTGSFDGLPEEARATGDEYGATFSAPSGGEFIVCISDKCPAEKLVEVIVHELVHVHTFSQSGADVREAMEVATELAAQLVRGNAALCDRVEELTRERDALMVRVIDGIYREASQQAKIDDLRAVVEKVRALVAKWHYPKPKGDAAKLFGMALETARNDILALLPAPVDEQQDVSGAVSRPFQAGTVLQTSRPAEADTSRAPAAENASLRVVVDAVLRAAREQYDDAEKRLMLELDGRAETTRFGVMLHPSVILALLPPAAEQAAKPATIRPDLVREILRNAALSDQAKLSNIDVLCAGAEMVDDAARPEPSAEQRRRVPLIWPLV